MLAKTCKLVGGIVITLLGLLVVFLAYKLLPGFPDRPSAWFWITGAAALGLVSGLTTGLSENPGSGTSFMTFLGAGLLVPIIGGVAALLEQTVEVTEKSTYLSDQLVEKTTMTVTSFSDGSVHPLAVLGSFFLVFGVVAVLGIVGGALLRESGLTVKNERH